MIYFVTNIQSYFLFALCFIVFLNDIRLSSRQQAYDDHSHICNLQFELAMSTGCSSSVGSCFKINNFMIKQQIGSGKFGIVYRAIQKYSQKQVAIKIIPKKNINNSTLHKQLQRQIEIHSKLKHPFICELYAYFHDSHSIYIVLEYCPHGSLATPIKQTKEVFSNKKIASIFEQIVQALAYMHERKVMHRDLKLQNILLDQFYNAKISDFGWCIHQNIERKTFCGTMEYICPQMIKKEKYSHSIDIYCLGIILYELFYFCSPFLGVNEQETFKKIREAEVHFDDSIRVIPQVAKKLLKELLNKNPEERPKASSLINHEFIVSYLHDNEEKSKRERITEKQFKKWRESLTIEETCEIVQKIHEPIEEINEVAQSQRHENE